MRKLLILLALCIPTLAFAGDLEKEKALELISSTVQIKMPRSQATGVVLYSEISEDDERIKKTYIITNKHVAIKVGKSCQIKKFVFLKQRNTIGRRQYEAKVVFVSKANDIALIEIETPPSENFNTVEICPEKEWDKMTLYDKLYLVSCGAGTVPCVTRGTLSSVDKDETEMGFTAQIIYGSSGGGIYNDKGQLIGVANAVKLTHGHPITHKALGIPLTTILKDLRESDFSFILDDYDDEAEDDEEAEEDDEDAPPGWEDWENWEDFNPEFWEEDEDNKHPEAPEPEVPETPKKKIWY
jgi:Trypsin-like peptidase domain